MPTSTHKPYQRKIIQKKTFTVMQKKKIDDTKENKRGTIRKKMLKLYKRK